MSCQPQLQNGNAHFMRWFHSTQLGTGEPFCADRRVSRSCRMATHMTSFCSMAHSSALALRFGGWIKRCPLCAEFRVSRNHRTGRRRDIECLHGQYSTYRAQDVPSRPVRDQQRSAYGPAARCSRAWAQRAPCAKNQGICRGPAVRFRRGCRAKRQAAVTRPRQQHSPHCKNSVFAWEVHAKPQIARMLRTSAAEPTLKNVRKTNENPWVFRKRTPGPPLLWGKDTNSCVLNMCNFCIR